MNGQKCPKNQKKGSCVERISTHKNVNNDRVNMKFCAKYVLTGQGRVDRQLMSRKKLFCTKKPKISFIADLVVEMFGSKIILKTHKRELKFCVWYQIDV